MAPQASTSVPEGLAAMAATNAVFDRLARSNAAASMTVIRRGEVLVARASGTTIDGNDATSDSPMLVASVSKLITTYVIAALEQEGRLDLAAPVPWDVIGIEPQSDWGTVTIRELLDHTSGMPVARSSWFDGGVDCRSHLPGLVRAAPQAHRGVWRYSNGNYCALGLLIEGLTGEALDHAAQHLVFDPLGIEGVHSLTDGLLPGDVPHPSDLERLSRLGGAGIFVASTDDLAAMLAATDFADYATIRPPGVFTDQYGWGHTGTVDGAISCAWVLDDGQTVLAATIAGNSPAKGGAICDLAVPAVANDLGIGQGRPDRIP